MKLITLDDVDKLTGRQFEFFISKLYRINGGKTKITPATNNHGADVIFTDCFNNKFAIQIKLTHGNSIGYKAIEEAIAGQRFYKTNYSAVLTNGWFSSKAQRNAEKLHVWLLNRKALKTEIDKANYKIAKTDASHKYSSLRLNLHIDTNLKRFQHMTGDSNKSKLITRLINIAKPKILDNKFKRKKYKMMINNDVNNYFLNDL